MGKWKVASTIFFVAVVVGLYLSVNRTAVALWYLSFVALASAGLFWFMYKSRTLPHKVSGASGIIESPENMNHIGYLGFIGHDVRDFYANDFVVVFYRWCVLIFSLAMAFRDVLIGLVLVISKILLVQIPYRAFANVYSARKYLKTARRIEAQRASTPRAKKRKYGMNK